VLGRCVAFTARAAHLTSAHATVDIVIEDGFYTIYMDVPGLSAKDISLARQNVITIIKGSRSVPYPDTQVRRREPSITDAVVALAPTRMPRRSTSRSASTATSR
jgi:hypothetical protein